MVTGLVRLEIKARMSLHKWCLHLLACSRTLILQHCGCAGSSIELRTFRYR